MYDNVLNFDFSWMNKRREKDDRISWKYFRYFLEMVRNGFVLLLYSMDSVAPLHRRRINLPTTHVIRGM